MTSPLIESGGFDDVALAVQGASPIIIAVCADPSAVSELAEWLETAIPARGRWCTERIMSAALLSRVRLLKDRPVPVAWIVDDAAAGTEEILRTRWTAWNAAREELRVRSSPAALDHAVVLLVTIGRMSEIVRVSADLMSIAQILLRRRSLRSRSRERRHL